MVVLSAVTLDLRRGDPSFAAPAVVGILLPLAWQTATRSGGLLNAAFAAVLLLRLLDLTAATQPGVLPAVVLSAGTLFLAAGVSRSTGELAERTAGAVLILAACIEGRGSDTSASLLAAALCGVLAAGVLSNDGRPAGRPVWGVLRIAAVLALLPLLTDPSGGLWLRVALDQLGRTVSAPLTGIPEPDGGGGLLVTLLWLGPLLAAPRWWDTVVAPAPVNGLGAALEKSAGIQQPMTGLVCATLIGLPLALLCFV